MTSFRIESVKVLGATTRRFVASTEALQIVGDIALTKSGSALTVRATTLSADARDDLIAAIQAHIDAECQAP